MRPGEERRSACRGRRCGVRRASTSGSTGEHRDTGTPAGAVVCLEECLLLATVNWRESARGHSSHYFSASCSSLCVARRRRRSFQNTSEAALRGLRAVRRGSAHSCTASRNCCCSGKDRPELPRPEENQWRNILSQMT